MKKDYLNFTNLKTGLKIIILLITATLVAFSTVQKTEQKAKFELCFPQKIKEVYYKKWVGGIKGAGGGINFYLEFKKPLSAKIQLQKIYFQKKEGKIQLRSKNVYVAYFRIKPSKEDEIIENNTQNVNTTKPQNPEPIAPKFRFDLKENEAVLEYLENHKTKFFKIKNIKEMPMIPYP